MNLMQSQPALGEATKLSQQQFGWTPARTYDGAIGHGLCAPGVGSADRSIAAFAYLLEPALGKMNISGLAHPNLYGQELYRDALAEQLIPGLLG